MKLLFLLDGQFENISNSHALKKDDFYIVKIDDKKLAKPKYILQRIRSDKFENVFFGCINLEFQRFHSFMLIYFLLSGYWKGAILDEHRQTKSFSFFKLFFFEIPKILIECIFSFFIIIYNYIKIPILKRLWTTNN